MTSSPTLHELKLRSRRFLVTPNLADGGVDAVTTQRFLGTILNKPGACTAGR